MTVHVLQGEREMASANKSLARFDLAGIQPAPRGMPQIEVTFDIDANGIVSVSAKDLATNKEQSIQITASSGLSKEEIDQAIKDAEMHADEDRKKKELVEARNQADSLIYSTEKSIKDLGDKVDEAIKTQAQDAIEPLRKAMEGEDPEEIKRLSEALTQASHKLAEAMYQQASQEGAAGAEDGPQGDPQQGAADVATQVSIGQLQHPDDAAGVIKPMNRIFSVHSATAHPAQALWPGTASCWHP